MILRAALLTERHEVKELEQLLTTTLATDPGAIDLLVASHPWRSHLPHWITFYEQVSAALLIAGKDIKVVLRGIST